MAPSCRGSVTTMLPDLRGTAQLATALVQAGLGKAFEAVSQVAAAGNKDEIVFLVRSEVDQVVGRMGFVREDELAALRRHVDRLEQELREAQAAAPSSAGIGGATAPAASTAKKQAKGPADQPKPAVKRRKRPAAGGADS